MNASMPELNIAQLLMTPEFVAQSTAITEPHIFGDERDKVISKFNRLQAFAGLGKGYFQGETAVDFNRETTFNRFKTCCYKPKEQSSEHEGLVGVIVGKSAAEMNQINVKQIFVESFQKCIASLSIQQVHIHNIVSLGDKKCVVILYAIRPGVSGGIAASRVYSSDLSNALCQSTIANQLKIQLMVENVYPVAKMSKMLEKQYLENPPMGIHPTLWQQAINNNPNSKLYIPIVVCGFDGLNERTKDQMNTVSIYRRRLQEMSARASALTAEQSALESRSTNMKRKLATVSLRLLKVISNLEIYRRQGYDVDSVEDGLRTRISRLSTALSQPTNLSNKKLSPLDIEARRRITEKVTLAYQSSFCCLLTDETASRIAHICEFSVMVPVKRIQDRY